MFTRHWCKTTFKFFVVLIVLHTCRADDWTKCPNSCRCKWVSGKKVAECGSAGFTAVPNTLSSEIQVLDLNSNAIPALTKDAFRSVGLVNLHKLFLKGCGIREVDKETFRQLSIMIELDLSTNKITSLHPETFKSNQRLRVLYLNDNPLGKLGDLQFPALPHLHALELKKCQLEFISKKAFVYLSTLEILLLSDNRLTTLRPEVIEPLSKLKSLHLENNPWRCDCRLQPFRDWLVDKKLISMPTACVEPARLNGISWSSLQSQDFACRPEIQVLEEVIYGVLGSNVTLSCMVTASPRSDVKWVLSGRILSNSSKTVFGPLHHIINAQGGVERWTNLTIVNADQDDSGEYTCVAQNSGGVSERNVTLLFSESPPAVPQKQGELPWAILIGGVVGGVAVLLILSIVIGCCCCHRKRRLARADGNANGKSRPNGNVAFTDQTKQLLLVDANINPLKKPPRSHGNYEGVPQTDVETMLAAIPPTYIACERYDDVASPGVQQPSPRVGGTPPIPSSRVMVALPPIRTPEQDSHYPDLLDIPARAKQSSPSSSASTAPDTSRVFPDPRMATLPQTLNPARLATSPPPYFAFPDNSSTPRPGYVTLPRKPRVASWGGQSPPPPAHTPGSNSPLVKVEPMYDNLGPRTTADGSSWLALDDLHGGSEPRATPSLPPLPVTPVKKVPPKVPPKPRNIPKELLAVVPEARLFEDECEDGTEV